MKVTGFTFIRNAIKFDYPIVEAIKSILPICDNFVVAVGNSQDETLALIKSIAPDKIKIVETVWDDSLREGGRVLAEETDKALAAVDEDSDWCFYIQGDEVVHEQYLPTIKAAMAKWNDDEAVDGLLLKYLHFYGSYDYVGVSIAWYNHEIRVVKNNRKVYSYKDAQGFRKNKDEKLTVVPIDAFVYHYGWVKEPTAMQRKQETFNKLWHDDEWMSKNVRSAEQFDYSSNVNALEKFGGTHPAVMKERIANKNWQFDYDISFNKLPFKLRLKNFVQSKIGYNLSYENYIIKK
ncbi:MAG: glycosyltransferase family 2 protein [Chitinophagaceae bacterium]|nr:glycosyltransferase family 2 protein [Chitinophagaceae bacterium]